MWPATFLEESVYTSAFSLPSAVVYRRLVLAGAFAAAFDLASSFWQVQMPSDANFVIEDSSGELWRIDRLPFGVDCAPELMQLITLSLVELSCPESLTTAVHIDNCIGVGSLADVTAWCARFAATCKKFNATLNDEPANTPSTVNGFCGIEFDFSSKKVCLAKRFIDTLPAANALASATNEEYESIVGKLLYGAAVLALPLWKHWWGIKWWRRRLSALSLGGAAWQGKARPPGAALDALTALLRAVRANTAAVVHPPVAATRADIIAESSRLILCTDASPSGWGAVLFEDGCEPEVVGARWAVAPPSTGVAETAAVVGALARFADRLRGRAFALLVDNTALEHAVLGQPRAWAMQLCTARVVAMLRGLRCRVVMGRIESNVCAADAFSRGMPADPFAMQTTVDRGRDILAAHALGREATQAMG